MDSRTGIGIRRCLFAVAAGLAVPCIPAASDADQLSDPDLVVAVLRELFPEVESVTSLPASPGQPAARLTATSSYDASRARVRKAFESGRAFTSGATVGGVGDRPATRDLEATVYAHGGRLAGSFVMARKGRGVVLEVFAAPAAATGASLPPRRPVPDPWMWLFPL